MHSNTVNKSLNAGKKIAGRINGKKRSGEDVATSEYSEKRFCPLNLLANAAATLKPLPTTATTMSSALTKKSQKTAENTLRVVHKSVASAVPTIRKPNSTNSIDLLLRNTPLSEVVEPQIFSFGQAIIFAFIKEENGAFSLVDELTKKDLESTLHSFYDKKVRLSSNIKTLSKEGILEESNGKLRFTKTTQFRDNTIRVFKNYKRNLSRIEQIHTKIKGNKILVVPDKNPNRQAWFEELVTDNQWLFNTDKKEREDIVSKLIENEGSGPIASDDYVLWLDTFFKLLDNKYYHYLIKLFIDFPEIRTMSPSEVVRYMNKSSTIVSELYENQKTPNDLWEEYNSQNL